jgi:ATP/maltotriose-dependent transcriptional regulator MalT
MNFLLTPPNPGPIIGRQALLADIHAALRKGGSPVALVHGIGGIGKTTAAAAYAHHPEYAQDYDAVCWIEVTSSLPDAFVFASPLQRFLGVERQVEQALLTPQPDPDFRGNTTPLLLYSKPCAPARSVCCC